MAWMANSNFLKMCAGGMASNLNITYTTTTANYIRVYKGVIPSDPSTYSIAGYSSDLLCTFTNFSITRSGASVVVLQIPSPADVTATGTGTATWFAMTNTSSPTKFLLGDVSTNGGTGALYISTVNIVSGNTVSYLNFSVTFYGV